MIGRILDVITTKLVRVSGSSMAPTLPNGAWVLVNRRAYKWPNRPERFDIVRFEHPSVPGRWLVKRIVGLPEEEVRFDSGQLYVDGKVIFEPHIGDRLPAGLPALSEWKPCTNEYVLLGDNRDASTDSRMFGTVPMRALRGRVTRRVR